MSVRFVLTVSCLDPRAMRWDKFPKVLNYAILLKGWYGRNVLEYSRGPANADQKGNGRLRHVPLMWNLPLPALSTLDAYNPEAMRNGNLDEVRILDLAARFAVCSQVRHHYIQVDEIATSCGFGDNVRRDVSED